MKRNLTYRNLIYACLAVLAFLALILLLRCQPHDRTPDYYISLTQTRADLMERCMDLKTAQAILCGRDLPCYRRNETPRSRACDRFILEEMNRQNESTRWL